MTTKEKMEIIENSPIIGYWSEMGGVEVRKIEDTIDGIKLYIKANAWYGKPSYHTRTVTFERRYKREHIRLFHRRLYLDECIREFGGAV